MSIALIFITDASLAENIALDDSRWRFSSPSHSIEQHLERQALRLQGGLAWIDGLVAADVLVEFDMAFGPERGFSGALWRMQDEANYENFYMRPHQRGNPDAVQYTPVFNGVSAWQLYHGPGYSGAVNFPVNQWLRVSIEVRGRTANIIINDNQGSPIQIQSLQQEWLAGKVGLSASGFAPAWYTNVSITALKPLSESADHPLADSRHSDSRAITRWQVSTAFEENLLDGHVLADNLTTLETRALQTNDPSGITNLAKLSGVSKTANTVLASFTVHADQRVVRQLRFGYSDRVVVYLNGQQIYSGDNTYESRDYRYLGTIGLFDALSLDLPPGHNVLSFAVTEQFGGWGIMAHFDSLEGITLEQGRSGVQ